MCAKTDLESNLYEKLKDFDYNFEFKHFCSNCNSNILGKPMHYTTKKTLLLERESGLGEITHYKVLLECPFCSLFFIKRYDCYDVNYNNEHVIDSKYIVNIEEEENNIQSVNIDPILRKYCPEYSLLKTQLFSTKNMVDHSQIGILYRLCLEYIIAEYLRFKGEIPKEKLKNIPKLLTKEIDEDIIKKIGAMGFYIGNDISHNREKKWINSDTYLIENILIQVEYYILNKIKVKLGLINPEKNKTPKK